MLVQRIFMWKPKTKKLLGEKTLVVFDFDGTITTSNYRSSWEVVHKYFGTWQSHGQNALDRYLKGEISYEKFCKLDAMAWIGRSEQEYQKALDSIELRDGIIDLIQFLKERKCKLAIISLGLYDVVEKFARENQFNYWLANDILRHDGTITGEIDIKINSCEKGKVLRSVLQRFRLSSEDSIAIGDGSADIELFEEAGFSIAVKPSSETLISKADLVMQTTDFNELIRFFKSQNL